MIRFSKKLLKRPSYNLFSPIFVCPSCYLFSSKEAAPAEEEEKKTNELDDFLALTTKKVSSKKKLISETQPPEQKEKEPDEKKEDDFLETNPSDNLIYSVEGSDTELGDLPDYRALYDSNKDMDEITEETILQLKERNIQQIKIPIPDNNPPHLWNSVNTVKLRNILESMRTKDPFVFYNKYMRRKVDVQMQLFPKTLQDISLSIPFTENDQIDFLKQLLSDIEIDKKSNKLFKVPGFDVMCNINKTLPKNFRNLVGKEIMRFNRDLEEKTVHYNFNRMTNIFNHLVESFSLSIYEINIKDFRFLILKNEFLQHVHVFFNPKFFEKNTYLIGNLEIEQIIKTCGTNKIFMRVLELVRYHKKFLQPGSQWLIGNKSNYYEFIKNLSESSEFNYISFVYHTSRIYQTDHNFFKMLNLSEWNKAFINVYWSNEKSSETQEIFHDNIYNLLINHYKISLFDKLTIFLIDLTLNAKSYKEAKGSIALMIMILARIHEKIGNLNDLYDRFISTLSQDSFDFYIKNSLGEILQSSTNRSYYDTFQKSLICYESRKPVETSDKNHFEPKTFFEQKFFMKNKNTNLFENIFIGYRYKYENLADQLYINPISPNIFSIKEKDKDTNEEQKDLIPEVSQNIQYQDAINFLINKDYYVFFEKIEQEFGKILNTDPSKKIFKKRIQYTFKKEKGRFFKLFQENKVDPSLISEKDPKQLMSFIFKFLKPIRRPMTNLREKNLYERRLESYVIRLNNELKKFAEARENYSYGAIEMYMLRKMKKKGKYMVRRKGNFELVRVDSSGKIIFGQKINTAEDIQKSLHKKNKGQKKIEANILEKFRVSQETIRNKNKNKKKIEKQGANTETPKKIENKTKAGFATMKENKNLIEEEGVDDYDIENRKNDMESGFKIYLQKLKEIEEVKKKDDEKHKDDVVGMTKQEIDQMKKSLFKEDSSNNVLTSKQFKEIEESAQIFTKIKTKPPSKSKKNENQEESMIKSGSKFDKALRSQKEKGQIIEEEAIKEDEKIKIPYKDFWLKKFEERPYDVKEIVRIIEKNLEENSAIKKQLLISLAYTNTFGTNMLDGVLIIEALMGKGGEKKVKVTPNDKLKIEFHSQMGQISRDYNHYMKVTCLDFDLPAEVYAAMLEFHVKEENFSRKYFKKILTHMLYYNKELPHEAIVASIKVFKQRRMGMSMLEFIYLILKKQPLIQKESCTALMDHLKDYKVLSEDIEVLVKTFLKEYQWEYEMSFLDSYIESLMKKENYDAYMMIFEKMKDFLMERKPLKSVEKDEQILEIKENEQIEETNEDVKENTLEKKKEKNFDRKFKKKESIEAHRFYIDFVEKLNKHKAYVYSKLVFYDFINNKFTLDQRDYIIGLKCFNDSAEEFLVLYNQFKETPFFVVDEKLMELLIEAINLNPKQMTEFFETILEEYVYSKKIVLQTNTLNSFLWAFSKTQKFFEFTDFLRFLYHNKHELNRGTKLICYKVLNRVNDEMSKPYIKGLIDSLFDQNPYEQEEQQRLKTIRLKNEARQAKKEAKKEKLEGKQEEPQDEENSQEISISSAQNPNKQGEIFKKIEDFGTSSEKPIKQGKSIEKISEIEPSTKQKPEKVDNKESTSMKSKNKLSNIFQEKQKVAMIEAAETIVIEPKRKKTLKSLGKADEKKVEVQNVEGQEVSESTQPTKKQVVSQPEKKIAEKSNIKKESADKGKKKGKGGLFDRIENLDKFQTTKVKGKQSRVTWNRVNNDIGLDPFEED